jgi:hypothetical protein
MSCTLEWLSPMSVLIRVHPDADARYGDPYIWWTAGVIRPGGVIELKGADRPLPAGGARAICTALKAAGFTHRTHDRIVDGALRTVLKEL